MHDLISRQALCEYALNQKDKSVTPNDIMRFPSAQPDLSAYSDKLWQAAYERGKREAEAERKRGEWIVHKAPDELHCGYVECPFCKEELIGEPSEYSFCPSCGAKLTGRR